MNASATNLAVNSAANRLCVSILPSTTEELFALLPRCADADLIELRLDSLVSTSIHAAQELDWKRIRAAAQRPLLVTYRLPSEGGFFPASYAPKERAALYQAAMDAGVEYIDIEAASLGAVGEYLHWSGAPSGQTEQTECAALVLSKHLFEPRSEASIGGLSNEQMEHELNELFATATPNNVEIIYKLIFTANGINAALVTRHALEYARKRGKRLIVHAMSEFGEPSRLLGALWGNEWTYCALDASNSTASGQTTLHEARHVYRLQEKTPKTRLFALLGFPTKQSKGKFLHNTLAERLLGQVSSDNGHLTSRDFLYFNLPTPNAENAYDQWQRVLHGASVTIPHKEAVFGLAEQHGTLSAEARRSEACNTVLFAHARPIQDSTQNAPTAAQGYNTDVLALEDCLQPHAESLRDELRKTLVIGTGATTQSVLTALERVGGKAQGVRTVITGRNEVKGQELARNFGCTFVAFDALDTLDEQSYSCIVQTTPVGMFPNTDETPLPAKVLARLFKTGVVVMDVIYNPLVTTFLVMARSAGCITVSGEEMFIRQAAHQFRLFTGVDVPLATIRKLWSDLH